MLPIGGLNDMTATGGGTCHIQLRNDFSYWALPGNNMKSRPLFPSSVLIIKMGSPVIHNKYIHIVVSKLPVESDTYVHSSL